MAQRTETLCVHAGGRVDPAHPGLVNPIYPSTAYEFPHASGKVIYPRYQNVATHEAVAAKIAALEHGEEALVFGSGMAAISTALFALVKAGDHVIFPKDIYGGTFNLAVQDLPRFGIDYTLVPGVEAADFEAALRPETRLVYLETPSNPLLRITDLKAVAAWAKARGLLTLIDNTFASPINQTPLDLGVDLVAHSATKYLNGHTDVNCGAVIASKALMDPIRSCAMRLGGMLDVRGAWLLERGLKTLALRVRRQNENAQRLAEFLSGHSQVRAVHYPGLPSHPQHRVAAGQMRGFGGMLSFDLPEGWADAVLKRLRLITPAISLGGVESVIVQPSRTSHQGLPPVEKAALGITDDLLRLSVGIEDWEDLRDDLGQALAG
jgi:cystathionine beta-lyase